MNKKILLAVGVVALLAGLGLFLKGKGSGGGGFDHEHAAWKLVVDSSVTMDGAIGYFNYKPLVADKKPLTDYITTVHSVTQSQFDSFSREQKLAFLTNAYNAFTVQQIVELYPLESIQQIEYEPGVDAWHKKRFTLLGKTICLDELENEWIRPVFKEPLIHFALVCASMGCPGLRWYSASQYQKQAQESAKAFLQDTRRNTYDPKTSKLMLSEIFDWFKDDFDAVHGSVAAFIAPMMTADAAEQEKIRSGKAAVEYFPYDGALNEKK